MYEDVVKRAACEAAVSNKGPVTLEVDRHAELGRAFHEQLDRLERLISPILLAVPAPPPSAGTAKVSEAHECDLHRELLANTSAMSAAYNRLMWLGDRVRL